MTATPLQFAIVGCGLIGRKRAASLQPGQLRYACDLDATRAAELAKANPGATALTDYEQALDDPLCLEVNQAARALPFFVGIGERLQYANRVSGLGGKIEDVLTKYKSDPDGLIFEILVALSYAASGWEVQFLDEQPPRKTPDFVATHG